MAALHTCSGLGFTGTAQRVDVTPRTGVGIGQRMLERGRCVERVVAQLNGVGRMLAAPSIAALRQSSHGAFLRWGVFPEPVSSRFIGGKV